MRVLAVSADCERVDQRLGSRSAPTSAGFIRDHGSGPAPWRRRFCRLPQSRLMVDSQVVCGSAWPRTPLAADTTSRIGCCWRGQWTALAATARPFRMMVALPTLAWTRWASTTIVCPHFSLGVSGEGAATAWGRRSAWPRLRLNGCPPPSRRTLPLPTMLPPPHPPPTHTHTHICVLCRPLALRSLPARPPRQQQVQPPSRCRCRISPCRCRAGARCWSPSS